MPRNTEETERPTEWLRRLQEDASRYLDLLGEPGGLSIAAYRLARARCRVQPVPTLLPTVTELMTAARELARRVSPNEPVPISSMVLVDCELAGFTVIRPVSDAA